MSDSAKRMNTVFCYDLGKAPYRETWALQAAIQQRLISEKLRRREQEKTREATSKSGGPAAAASADGTMPAAAASADGTMPVAAASADVLLFVEHPHVYTLGKSGDASHLLRSAEELVRLGATYEKIDRGGDITYHGPGQIVGYPILDLDRYFTDIHKYLRYLEEVIIRVCADYGIQAARVDKLTGVWVGEAKICAFGIRCSRWVTMHGFALNVNAQLDYFGHIVPCGISDKAVCSMASLLKHPVDETEVKSRIIHHFEDLFACKVVSKQGFPDEYAQIKR